MFSYFHTAKLIALSLRHNLALFTSFDVTKCYKLLHFLSSSTSKPAQTAPHTSNHIRKLPLHPLKQRGLTPTRSQRPSRNTQLQRQTMRPTRPPEHPMHRLQKHDSAHNKRMPVEPPAAAHHLHQLAFFDSQAH